MRKMNMVFVWLAVLMLVGNVFSADTSVSASAAFMTLPELEEFLRSGPVSAYFKSVPQGLTSQQYKIKIEGIFEEPGLKVIMFTTRHQIAAGMSGSPVYVHGKLLGAMAYSFNNFSEISWGGISSIILMMEERRRGSKSPMAGTAGRSFYYQQKHFTPIALGGETISPFLSVAPDNMRVDLFRNTKLNFFSQGGSLSVKLTAAERQQRLKPGMPIAVDLLEWQNEKGELNLASAVGTITYVDPQNGEIFAFGHPFMAAGQVRYIFRSCEIIGTAFSQFNPIKIPGRKSEVLGTITYDSFYGVYGQIGVPDLNHWPTFKLELKKQGDAVGRFEVRMADNKALIPSLMQWSMLMVGVLNGAPAATEKSTTELTVRVGLNDYPEVKSHVLLTSKTFTFGGGLVHLSSYEAAVRKTVWEIYVPLAESNYDFSVTAVEISANFLVGQPPELTVMAYRFPHTVRWGENPTLEIVLISEDNRLSLAKKMTVMIDWEKVEQPVYTAATSGIEKEEGKRVEGVLKIFHPRRLGEVLTENEKQIFLPKYFLDAQDFLKYFAWGLSLEEPAVLGWIHVRSRNNPVAEQQETKGTALVLKESEGWHIIKGRLTSRAITWKNEQVVSWPLNFPPLPPGYLVDWDLNETFGFEVVKKE